MAWKLRLLDPERDFPAVVDLHNTYEHEPVSLEQFAGWVARMPAGRICRRMVAEEQDGRVVAYNVVNYENWYPAGNFELWVVVAPDCRRRGLGAAMLTDALQYAQSQDAHGARIETHEADPRSQRFLERFGFSLDRRIFESILDLTEFDPAPYAEVEQRVAAAGIRIVSLAEMGYTRDNLRRLHAVNYATALDIPGASAGWMSFDEFEAMVSSADWFNPQGQFGALDGEEWIGLSAVRLMPAKSGSYNLMTGVLPAYRGRGIATALKLTAIRYARSQGATYMRTNNDSLNAAMLAVNTRLGYAAQPGILVYRRELVEGDRQ